ncbi:MAG: glutaredoxin family protein [Candidatus Terrybacteria bacterium]|nr:glutaredoxin family protein [Candidatus Terrybacteria bacterium]
MKNVIIYSTPTCIYCRMAKDWFKEKGIDYTEYDLSIDAAKRDEVIEKSGQMAVPVIEIEGEIIIGFDKKKITELLGINK